MRREGYELTDSKAEVIFKTDENVQKTVPIEIAYVDVPEIYSGNVIQKLTQRKGLLNGMNKGQGEFVRLEFTIPSRDLIGYRGEFLTDTKGTGILNIMFNGYGPYLGDFQYRQNGSIIALDAGTSKTYGLFNAQERGILFIGPGETGMIVGQNPKSEDIEVNVCKTKK